MKVTTYGNGIRIILPNFVNSKHYEDIENYIIECDELPVIRCVQVDATTFAAIEGSHRLTAIKILDYQPNISLVSLEDGRLIDDTDLEYFSGEAPTVGEVAEYILRTAPRRQNTLRFTSVDIHS